MSGGGEGEEAAGERWIHLWIFSYSLTLARVHRTTGFYVQQHGIHFAASSSLLLLDGKGWLGGPIEHHLSMDNGSISTGSSHLTDNSFRTASSSLSSLPEASPSAPNPPDVSTSISFSPPPVPWSEPPVPSPLPHPPLLGSSVTALPSPSLLSSPGHPVRFNTDPSSSPSASPSIAHSLGPLLPQAPVSVATSSPSSASLSPSSSSSSASSPTSSERSSSGSPLSSSSSSETASLDRYPHRPVEEQPPLAPSSNHTPNASLSNAGSPPYSAFQSASDTPFYSPTTPAGSTPFLTPPSDSISSSAIHTPRGGDEPAPPRTSSAALFANSTKDSPFSPPHNLFPGTSALPPQSPFFTKLSAPHESPGPSFPRHASSPGPSFLGQSASPSSAGRPRSCDVFISLYGKCPSLHRFGKWMRAELELQGVACFSADRSLYSDTRSHDIARRIMNSATFGVVLISRDVFCNPWTMEELRVFLDRKNLIPVFFDIAPLDCSPREIVERQGWIWGRQGGELWTMYDGDEREWRDVLEGLLRVEDWRLEAYDGNWRACIQRAVGLLGSRLGRRSIAEREKVRIERIDVDEFPFHRNGAFTGREKELRTLEDMLFMTKDGDGVAQQDSAKGSREGQGMCGSGCGSRDKVELPRVRDRQQHDVARGLRGKEPGIQSSSSEIGSSKEISREITRPRERGRDTQRGRQLHRERTMQRKREAHNAKEHMDPSVPHSHGCACISGQSGIGKTDLALEYAYRNAQKYKLILWVSAENRYIRQNYLDLSQFLGVDVGGSEMHSLVANHPGRVRTFDEQETEAYQRIRRELSRDIPYLLIIDNLESERDWWDGKEISDLLPTAGGTSHVIITTCLPRVLQFETMELSLLSGTEALNLMRGRRSFSSLEQDDLKEIDDKLARLTFGLAIVGRLLNDFPFLPSELLDAMKQVEAIADVRNREDEVLRNNPWLFRLLNVCFSLLEIAEGPTKLAAKMAWVGGWFAPAPVPFSLLALSASRYREKSQRSGSSLSRSLRAIFCCCLPGSSHSRRKEGEAGYLLIRYGIARRSTREGCLCFHDIVQIFARRRGGIPAATAAVQGVRKGGVLHLHLNHYWAASFLVLPFGNDTPTVDLRVPELLSFCRKIVIPLALCTFSSFTRCQAAIELLHLCYNMLEDVDKSFVSQIQEWWDKSFCLRKAARRGPQQVDEYVWQDLTLLKALLLENRAKMLVRGGLFEAGEEICRTCISIRTVMLGPEHPQTIAAHETLAKLVRARNDAYS